MINFTCPVCSKILVLNDRVYKCRNGHSFDLSRKGYVNLFQSKGSGKIHGDDKTMTCARTRFLDGGFYENLRNEVSRLAVKYSCEKVKVIDCGCGECYYTSDIYSCLSKNGKSPEIMGIDISKEAISAGVRRCRELKLAVGSVFHLPCESKSFDILITLFAPFCKEEYSRVLKDNGYLIMAIPLEEHLWELKQAIYDNPYKNQVQTFEIEGFRLIEKSELKNKIVLNSNQEITDLFSMTPYHYKTSRKDKEKLESLDFLEVTTQFAVLLYQKC